MLKVGENSKFNSRKVGENLKFSLGKVGENLTLIFFKLYIN